MVSMTHITSVHNISASIAPINNLLIQIISSSRKSDNATSDKVEMLHIVSNGEQNVVLLAKKKQK